jgi:hypothetical protein
MTEKQKAMLVLHGICSRQGMTKGEAASLIDNAIKSGMLPSKQNEAEAAKLFNAISLKECQEKLTTISKFALQLIQRIGAENITIKELKHIKTDLREISRALREQIDDRVSGLEDAEFERQRKEDEKRELGEID